MNFGTILGKYLISFLPTEVIIFLTALTKQSEYAGSRKVTGHRPPSFLGMSIFKKPWNFFGTILGKYLISFLPTEVIIFLPSGVASIFLPALTRQSEIPC